MGKQITLQNLQTSLDRTKSYVDSRANANVIKTETILFAGGVVAQNDILTLADGLSNYDALAITLSIANSSDEDLGNYVTQIEPIANFSDSALSVLVLNGYNLSNNNYVAVRLGLNTNTSLRASVAQTGSGWSGYKPYVSIKGVKYSHPVEYTTTEKVIGTYLGKTLYEKTLTNINVPAATTSVPTQVVALNAYGIEDTWTVVKAEGIVRLANNADIMVPFCNPLNTIPDAVWVSRQSSTGRWVLASCCQQTGVAKALTLKYIKESL